MHGCQNLRFKTALKARRTAHYIFLLAKLFHKAEVETVPLTVSISLLDSKWCKHLCSTVDYAEKHSIWQPRSCTFISMVSRHLVQCIHARQPD